MEKFIKACVSILPKPLQKIYYKYEEKWLYLVFGVLTTAVSFITAGISKYLTNRAWVFESHASGAAELAREAASFYGGRLLTLAVEWIMMHVGYAMLHFNYWIVKIVANIVVLILNYVISKIFVFRKEKEPAAKNE